MSQLIPVFQKTLDKTNVWLDEIMEQLDWSDRKQAYKALRAVLHTLRDRLPVDESTDFAAQLPMLIRGLYFDSWNPNAPNSKIKSSSEFVEAVNQHFDESEFVGAELITRAVLTVIEKHVSPGEVDDVVFNLPPELQELWNEV